VAARPVRRRVLAQIEEEGGWEPILEEIAQGVTLEAIAARYNVTRGFFGNLVREDPTRATRANQARKAVGGPVARGPTPGIAPLAERVEANEGWASVITRIRQGETVGKIAEEYGVSRGCFSEVLHSNPDRKRQVEAARRDGATALLEQAIEIADDVREDKDANAKAKLKADVRVRIAAMFDPERFGTKAGAQVNINVQDLHLDALRARQVIKALPGSEQEAPAAAGLFESDARPALPPASAEGLGS